MATNQGAEIKVNSASVGLDLNSAVSQVPSGKLTFALNAVIEGFDGEKVTYQNELGNTKVLTFPQGYRVIGRHVILEEDRVVFWLINTSTGDCEIGQIDANQEIYSTIINAKCLNFNIDCPILKTVHKKTNCGTEVYWVDGRNRARYIQLNDLPYQEIKSAEGCQSIMTEVIDCNKLNLQPNFLTPQINISEADGGGNLLAGTYQFAVQYANALGEPYTSYYSVTNPISLHDNTQATQDFNFPVNKALSIIVSNIDTTGIYDYVNVAVIKTINNISSVELIDTFQITGNSRSFVYSGQGKSDIKLSIDDIFQRYDYFDSPSDLTTVQDILILRDLKTEERLSYQKIANKIKLYWQTNRLLGKESYKKPENTLKYRGYMRDEVYALSVIFGLDNGYQTDEFPLISREANVFDLEEISNNDVLEEGTKCETVVDSKPRYKVYNTASVVDNLHPVEPDECYEGPWQYGEFAYWESTENYPCDPSIWGTNSNSPIKHFKFPDNLISPIHDNKGYIYPIGIRVEVNQIIQAIKESDLSDEQKSRIKWFKIVRSNRASNASVVAKGILTNVLKYSTENNIIDSETGAAEDTGDANSNIKGMLNDSIGYIKKAKNESQAFAGFIVSLPGLGRKNRKRMAEVIENLEEVLDSENFISQYNIDELEDSIEVLDMAISKSSLDIRGKSHLQAAKAVLQGAAEIMKAQLQLNTLMQEFQIDSPILADSNKFAYFPNYLFNDLRIDPNTGNPQDFFLDNTFIDDDAKHRYTFHSPDTSFYQPQLGRTLKIEQAQWGVSTGHLVEVKNHAEYQFISTTGYIISLLAGVSIGFASGSYGVANINIFNGEAAFSAYQSFLNILYKTVPYKNFAYQWNAVGKYDNYIPIQNEGNKQRTLDIAAYMSSGTMNMGDKYVVNNYQRESSVYLRTTKPLPFPHEYPSVPKDSSKIVGGTTASIDTPISCLYASIKNEIANQYGGIGDYELIDTGFQHEVDLNKSYQPNVAFGGDVFINRFAYKSKFPFFIDHRVGFPRAADISYNELSNVGRVKYWFSTDVTANKSIFDSFFATMTHNFFWPKIKELYLSGKIFLFAYGIPEFFCESTINVDMRQASNNKEGDFYPRVSSGIPDDWLQESNISINNDNIYFYNKTYSKQNKETFFSRIPPDFDFDNCRLEFPYRAVFSEQRKDSVLPSNRNNWRIFKPAARVDFPQNMGRLISIDGIENKQVLARFENKSLLYNALFTAPTNAGQIYMGKPLFSEDSLPLDFAETDLGYAGTQHKLLVKTEFGHLSIDAKRGSVFLFQGNKFEEISTEEVSNFLTNNLFFSILEVDNTINIDNHFLGIGLHGTYDNRFSRFIITKLDYKPLVEGITYNTGKFYYNNKEIQLTDTQYFANKSFTISYNLKTRSWVSFHSYQPNFYVGLNGRYYSSTNNELWKHLVDRSKFNNFYGQIHPYIIEYPFKSEYQDDIVQSIKDYTRVRKVNFDASFTQVDDVWFNKAILSNPQQCSGLLELVKKPKNNLRAQLDYPIYSTDSKTILYTKSDNFYNYNTFWSLIKNKSEPIFKNDNLSIFPVLNQSNMDYSKRSFKKEPIRGKELKIRHILDDRDDHNLISEFITVQTKKSWK